MSLIWEKNPIGCYVCSFVSIVNLVCLYGGILADPGISPAIYRRYSRHRNFVLTPPKEDASENDIEAGAAVDDNSSTSKE